LAGGTDRRLAGKANSGGETGDCIGLNRVCEPAKGLVLRREATRHDDTAGVDG